ncbi:class I SAM-dependent methyltransferase [Candidatus Thorarchaeota archaeon]|nr:MAG: class I SAM-dependent methyltransferase [Candidatus Thorarchaeota archaeon]
MTNHDRVPAPDGWMNAWGKIYREMFNQSDEDLSVLDVPRPIRRLKHALYMREIEPERLKAVDFGCGGGTSTCYLARLGFQVLGIDALPEAIEVARKRAEVVGVENRTTFEVANIAEYEVPPESYDIVSAIQILQYLFDDAISKLRELLKAVKPGGFFVYAGNIPPHFETDPPIRFVTQDELEEELDGWTLHLIGSDVNLLKPNDLRGFVWVIAEKPK